MVKAHAKAERVVLSHDLSLFLVEFSIALHKHAMYPSDHPSLGPSAARLAERAALLLDTRPMLAFGVARHQLIIDGVATDPNQPVLRRLAETLHRHHLGALSVLPGIEGDELREALHLLAREVDPETPPIGMSGLTEWPHIRLHPLTLDRLELVDDDGTAPADAAEADANRRGAQLWVGLANAAMAMDSSAPVDSTPDPTVVAKAIDDHTGAAAYDQVIVGYLLQIADELKSASGTDHGALRRRTARLISALQPETLQRLVTMGGNAGQRRAFVLGATSGMAVESVVKIVKAAADASNQTISHGLLRMLSKLAAHAEGGREHVKPMADGALREQVDRLLAGWKLPDPNSDAYGRTLQHLATTTGNDVRRQDERRSEFDADPVRMVQTCLEIGGSGPMVDRAIYRAIDTGAMRSLHELLATAPEAAGDTAGIVRQHLSGPRAVAALMSREPVDFDLLDALLPSIGVDSYEVLLEALIASPTRATRRKLLDRLAPTRLDVAPLIVTRLGDERWYVQRNLLLLLERLGHVPHGFMDMGWMQHSDPRVRYQALSLQLTIPGAREATLRAALEDSDERIIRLGLVACQTECPQSLLALIGNIAGNPRVDEQLRLHAVRALGASTARPALEILLRLVHGGKNMIGRPRLAPRTSIVLAALRALAEVWRASAEADRVLSLARRSFDPDLRRAVESASA